MYAENQNDISSLGAVENRNVFTRAAFTRSLALSLIGILKHVEKRGNFLLLSRWSQMSLWMKNWLKQLRERNFIAEKGKDTVLDDLVTSFLTSTREYLSHPNFAARYALREHLRRQQRETWYQEGNKVWIPSGPGTISWLLLRNKKSG